MIRILIVAIAISTPVSVFAQSEAHSAVRQAALDYVTAVYESRPELIERSVSADLTKHGFMRQRDGTYRHDRMTYQELLRIAKEWNADRKRDVSIKEVTVGHVLDHTATATLRASWGVDHMQLAKIGAAWKILNIVWQTPPPAPTTRP